MDKFLKTYFPNIQNLKKQQLPGDGGHRHYTRIQDNKKTFILMSCGKKDPSLKKFIEIQQKLNPFVSVPKIFHKSLKDGFLLLEDLGDQSLESFFLQNKIKLSKTVYYQALKQLACFQTQIKATKKDLVFDKDFFLQENEMAIYHLQTYLNSFYKKSKVPFNKNSARTFRKDMEKVLLNFKKKDYVYCHRDYHSRNLMLKNNKLISIDFQDAGLGPWYYDLTSLLYDSYVPLSPSIKKEFSKFYFKNLSPSLKKKALSLSHIELMTKLQFLQRGFKACGCFAAFKNRDKKNTHLKYIKPSLKLLQTLALELSFRGIHKYTKQMTDILEEQES